MKEDELNGLESYSTIENGFLRLNEGVISNSDGVLYHNWSGHWYTIAVKAGG
jgi:hypothetical protein